MRERGERPGAVPGDLAGFLRDWRLALPKHQPCLVRWVREFLLFARQQAPSKNEAEDILQEAVVQVWKKRHIFSSIEPGLVFLQIKRIAIDRARSDSRRKIREQLYSESEQPLFESSGNPGLATDIEHTLGQLPLEQREVIVLKVWAEQTFDAIARALDISPNTAASRYRYGLDKMRQLLSGESA